MGDSNSATVSARLDEARKELLDLTFRNPLLNYRHLKARGVEAIDASPSDILRTLVIDSRKIRFVATGTEIETPEEGAAGGAVTLFEGDEAEGPEHRAPSPLPSPDQPRRTIPEIRTRYSPDELQKRLLNTLDAANTAIQEMGINTLFLGLGQLQWYEDDTSEQPRKSPLVLIPVELERAAAADRFSLKYREEDVVDNASLAAVLAGEHHIQLAPIGAQEDIDLDRYFSDVAGLVDSKKRWTVDRDSVVLAFFSFAKYQMYKDLECALWPDTSQPTDHPILQAILGNGFREPPFEHDDNADIDSIIQVADSHLVDDSDSSQTQVVLDAIGGRNMVVQGPPGTGKSQTITNLIAESLSRGRKVLFVAEKMAALDVVKDRMTKVGLGDACLELHSNKSKKKAVLEDLRRTVGLRKPYVAEQDNDAAVLQGVQDRLNRYAAVANAFVANSGLTVHDVFGEHLSAVRRSEPTGLAALKLDGCSEWNRAQYDQRESLIKDVQSLVSRIGVPSRHLFWGTRRTGFVPTDPGQVREYCTVAGSAVEDLKVAAESICEEFGLGAPQSIPEAQTAAAILRRAISSAPREGVRLGSAQWIGDRTKIAALVESGHDLAARRSACESRVHLDERPVDVAALRQTIVELAPKWWKVVLARWRQAQNELKSLCKQTPPSDCNAQIGLLAEVIAYDHARADFQTGLSLGSAAFGAQWQGENSNWDELAAIMRWCVEFIRDAQEGRVSATLVRFLDDHPDLKSYQPQMESLDRLIESCRDRLRAVVSVLDLDEAVRFAEGTGLDAQPFSAVSALVGMWADVPDSLSDLALFNVQARDAGALGLSAVIRAVAVGSIAADGLAASFRGAYIWQLAQNVYTQHPELSEFAGLIHGQVIAEFRDRDRNYLKANRAMIALGHWDGLPNSTAPGEMGVLRHEFEKRARHLPLRRLLSEAGRAIQDIKPVLMMSPLSVAAYCAPGALNFDIVIFDEASQVRPVDAFGALIRGRQAVVVGDSQQLPPTSFFDTISRDESPVDDESPTRDLESVLGLFLAKGAPERSLKWHYRSRHESLIAVSNQEFYNNELIIFPSPQTDRQIYGLQFHHLPETVYDRGRSSTNRAEARIVAEQVMAHASRQVGPDCGPVQSLGVAAFSMAQMEAIRDEIERLRRQNPKIEPFFAPTNTEPFFVKNLENVQGDERDVIYISVGYGRDAAGKVSMNFGPLNGEGGARRLNVLITRARQRCEVFTNVTADDIVTTAASSHGLKAFKVFLEYAERGTLNVSAPSGRDPDSPFEREVAALLRSMNYDVVPQVGCSGYFIDMAIRDPEQPGRYLIGIECDGRTYHSARSARDRDRLREQVLRAQGWHLHRIWSTDWMRRPADEAMRLRNAIEEARERGRNQSDKTAVGPESEISYAGGGPDGEAAKSAPGDVIREEEHRKRVDTPAYCCATLPSLAGLAFGDYWPAVLMPYAVQVILTEGPVHVDEIARRIADAMGLRRVTDKLRRVVRMAVTIAQRANQVRTSGEFCWQVDLRTAQIRNRSALAPASRKLEYVAPEEIDEAILHCLREAYSLSLHDAARMVLGLLLGFDRLSQDNNQLIQRRIENLRQSGVLAMIDDRVSMAD